MTSRSATLLLTLCIPFAVLAQSEPDASIDDVVIVNGVRHPVQLRLQMLDAERNVYNLFNRFNDIPKLDIECSRHQITGTRLWSQVCQPEFERIAMAQVGQDYLAAYRAFMDVVALGQDPATQSYSPFVMIDPGAVIPAQQRRLQRRMKALTDEQPEFRDALVEYVELKIKYAQATSMARNPAGTE